MTASLRDAVTVEELDEWRAAARFAAQHIDNWGQMQERLREIDAVYERRRAEIERE